MPGIQDWRMTPHQNVSQMFEEHVRRRQRQSENRNEVEGNQVQEDNGNECQLTKKISDFFATILIITSPEEDWRKKIPSLNVTSNHHLVDGQMVRFRGMIQVN